VSRPFLKMRFFRDCGVCIVLKDPKQLRWGQLSSCITHTFRFSKRCILALIARDGMYAGFASLQGCNLLEQCRSICRGAKTCHEKSLFLETPSFLLRALIINFLILSFAAVQAEEIQDPMQPPAFALKKFQQARYKNRAKAGSTVKIKRPAVKPLKLTSILYSSDRKIAIIDDRMMRVGDTIRNAKLVRINRDGARLLKKGKFIELKLSSDLTAVKKTPSESKL
jgi:hypothetical protein